MLFRPDITEFAKRVMVALFSNRTVPPLAALLEILSELRAAGRSPIVILSDDVVEAPAATLSLLCGALGVPWDERMLSWPAGPKPYDGVWAPWWYTTVHGTTGKVFRT